MTTNHRKYECSGAYQDAVRDFVSREICYCVSSLISDAAQCSEFNSDEYDDLLNLCTSYGTFQEAAENEGWSIHEIDGDFYGYENVSEITVSQHANGKYYADGYQESEHDTEEGARAEAIKADGEFLRASDDDEAWEELCNDQRIDREESEVYEHWLVSNWLARKLAEKGETTGEWAGLTIWGRTCTGQSIYLDSVICELFDDLHPEWEPPKPQGWDKIEAGEEQPTRADLLAALRTIAGLTTNEDAENDDLLAEIQGECRKVLA